MFNRETGKVDYRLRNKSRKVMVDMPIDMFLHLAETGERADSTRLVGDLVEQGVKFNTTPILYMSFRTGDRENRIITGHEGRHRARKLKSMGYDTVPVMVMDTSIRWDSQQEGDFDRVEVFPKRIVSEEGDVVFPMFIDRNANVRYGRFGPQTEDFATFDPDLVPEGMRYDEDMALPEA